MFHAGGSYPPAIFFEGGWAKRVGSVRHRFLRRDSRYNDYYFSPESRFTIRTIVSIANDFLASYVRKGNNTC
jgi:hypothetical protein